MPQLDLSTYLDQIIWLFVFFGITYLFVKFLFVRRIKSTLKKRDDVISNLIQEAKDLNSKADKLEQDYKANNQELSSQIDKIINDTQSMYDEDYQNGLKILKKNFEKERERLIRDLEKFSDEFEKNIPSLASKLAANVIHELNISDIKVNQENLLKHLKKTS